MMHERYNKIILNWLLTVSALIMIMVVFGGYVRLTRSGLSIVEWDIISGIVPPIGEEAWLDEFAQYQQTPEFQIVNKSMTLAEYKEIFYLEYIHRLIARFAGLVVALPLLFALGKGILPWRKSQVYVVIGLLFAFQGYLGWYMVSSGLVERPEVSHFRLTIHLLAALTLLALTVWMALNHYYHFPARVPGAARSRPFGLALGVLLVLVVQIAYGGFMAGLKAGLASSSYPLMFGRWIPAGLLSTLEPWWLNLVSYTITVHFIHRWFAMVVLLVSWILYYKTRHEPHGAGLHKGIAWMVGLTAVQIALGVSVIWFHVPLILALSHQALALSLFVTSLFIIYQVVYAPQPETAVTRLEQVPTGQLAG